MSETHRHAIGKRVIVTHRNYAGLVGTIDKHYDSRPDHYGVALSGYDELISVNGAFLIPADYKVGDFVRVHEEAGNYRGRVGQIDAIEKGTGWYSVRFPGNFVHSFGARWLTPAEPEVPDYKFKGTALEEANWLRRIYGVSVTEASSMVNARRDKEQAPKIESFKQSLSDAVKQAKSNGLRNSEITMLMTVALREVV